MASKDSKTPDTTDAATAEIAAQNQAAAQSLDPTTATSAPAAEASFGGSSTTETTSAPPAKGAPADSTLPTSPVTGDEGNGSATGADSFSQPTAQPTTAETAPAAAGGSPAQGLNHLEVHATAKSTIQRILVEIGKAGHWTVEEIEKLAHAMVADLKKL